MRKLQHSAFVGVTWVIYFIIIHGTSKVKTYNRSPQTDFNWPND